MACKFAIEPGSSGPKPNALRTKPPYLLGYVIVMTVLTAWDMVTQLEASCEMRG